MSDEAMDRVVRVTVSGQTGAFEKGTRVIDVLRRLVPDQEEATLAVLRGGECMALNAPVDTDCELKPVTYQDEEGRRVYERSLRFLFLMCMRRLYPDKRVRILNSVGYGLYLRVLGSDMDHAMVEALEAEMNRLVAADLPFVRERWTLSQALAYFERENYPDKVKILRYRSKPEISMYHVDHQYYEYFYGAMLPSTGRIRHFKLKSHFPGMMLMFPSPDQPEEPAPYLPRPKHLRVFAESQRWCDILGVSNVFDVNRMIEQRKMREFIRISEALHDKSIAHIADEIVARGARIVLIFGPSSSGKTTFAHRLSVHLRVLGREPSLVSLDDFYLPRSQCPLDEHGTVDLESVDALDVPLITSCFERLLAGEVVDMPLFDFAASQRKQETRPLCIDGRGPLLVEGIHALNDRLTSELPEQLIYGIYVSALPCINLDDHNRIRTTDVRLLRRIVRDMKFRNTSPVNTIRMWSSVRSGEEKWIFPNQEKADIMFNTSLHYELPILKTIAYDVLSAIPITEPEYLVAHRLLKVLNYVLPVDDAVLSEIPPLSILREFIGECTFYDRH